MSKEKSTIQRFGETVLKGDISLKNSSNIPELARHEVWEDKLSWDSQV